MGKVKNKQLSQKYGDDELSLIEKEADKRHLKVATFIRLCVLNELSKGAE